MLTTRFVQIVLDVLLTEKRSCDIETKWAAFMRYCSISLILGVFCAQDELVEKIVSVLL
jgi:hypothetical protein